MPAKKPTRKKTKPDQSSEDQTKVAALSVQRMSLDALKPHPRNPRKHPAEGSAEWQVLAASLKHDYFDPLVWNVRNGMLVSGHLRKKVLHSLGFTDADVVVVDYDEPTHVARLMAANKSVGEDDTAKMQELFADLQNVGNFDLSVTGFTFEQTQGILAGGALSTSEADKGSGVSEAYTHKADAPLYTITGDKPDIASLCDRTRVCELIAEIEKSKEPEEVKTFLRIAAERHTRFDYGKIAEFYAHANKPLQQLMERSALVIIDFDKALEHGYAKLREGIRDLVQVSTTDSDEDEAQ